MNQFCSLHQGGAGARATSGKGGAFRLGCWTADSSFLALDSFSVLRPDPSSSSNSRQTHTVLPLRVTAALAGPRSSFPSYPPRHLPSIHSGSFPFRLLSLPAPFPSGSFPFRLFPWFLLLPLLSAPFPSFPLGSLSLTLFLGYTSGSSS